MNKKLRSPLRVCERAMLSCANYRGWRQPRR
jgi:hypothetical protein